jgi:poly-beta-1,6-N-acetyl-D-glucosamine N-deacetylase PgaB
MRRLLVLMILLLGGPAYAQPAGQRFVSIAFHDVADRVDELDTDAVTTRILAQFFDWLKGSGWTAISLDDIATAARGTRPLPDKAILISFDDGYRSLYTRVFPLLQIYRYPVVAAVVGSWMEARPDGTVQYGDRIVPRSHFISWAEAREMQASGLVEFASHSYDLHRGIQANPQGNFIPAAITWRYDPATRRYETDAQYRARIRSDLQRSRQQIAANLGRAPRAIVWPFGRYSGPALAEAKASGFTFALTLEPEPAYTSDVFAIHRYFPARNPTLADLARNLRFDPDYPATRRVACLSLDALAAAGTGAAQDAALGATIEGLRTLGANVAVIDAEAGPVAPGAPLGEVYFPNSQRPMRADLLSRATWQIRTRGGADVFLIF